MREEPIALVLGGGGARGAYEAGVLSVLLPVLEERDERPTILIGTSAGALNVSFVAAHAQLTTREQVDEMLATWRAMRWGDVVRRLISAASLRRAGAYAGEVLGLYGLRIKSLLDPKPLSATLRSALISTSWSATSAAGASTPPPWSPPPRSRVARLSFTAACSRRRRTIAAGSTTLLPNSWTSTCSPRRRFPGSSPPCRSSNRSALAVGTSTAGRASTRRSSRRSRSVRDAWSWWRSPRRPERAGPDRRACPARGPRAVLAAAAGDHIGRGAAREAHGCRR